MPVAFDTVDRRSCVCMLVTSTSAPGIGRPCSSWTMPVIVPVEIACWADATPPQASSTATPPATPVRRLPDRPCGAVSADLLLHPWTALLLLRE